MTITGKARLAGVLGWPVGHSRSPRLHNHWLQSLAIDGVYVPLAVAPADLPAVVAALPRMGFIGFNVTVPHKETIRALLDRVDPWADRIGAVNTVVVTADGRLEGRNTDAFGFLQNLRQTAPAWRAEAGPAVVLGAGGAARAVLAALIEAGIPEIRLLNRSRERAETLAVRLGGPIRAMAWEDRDESLDGAALLVNTTTLGMTGSPALAIDLAALPRSATVADLVYAPLETDLLRAARARGHGVVDGLGMLLWQAVPAFESWFGVRPEVTPSLREIVLGA